MSFKRDGDNDNLLKNLNHQRVRELLSNHIPQDEAKLLSNGRLACMICLYRPIFDTINMLALHRKGKRHLLELSKYIKCKEDGEMQELQRKRSYPDDIKEAASQPYLSPMLTQSPILGSKHVTAKQSVMRYLRKPILEIQPILSPKKPVLSDVKKTDKKTALATVRHYLKRVSRKSSLEKVVEKNRANYGADLQKDSQCKDKAVTIPVTKYRKTPSKSNVAQTRTNATAPSESQNYEIQLRMSGWIKDSSGTWIKDPNVEFDSDEDDTISLPHKAA